MGIESYLTNAWPPYQTSFQLPGTKGKGKGERGPYKTGNWLWNAAFGAIIGTTAVLTAAGWFGRLAANFIFMDMVLVVAYIIVRGRNLKVDAIGNLMITVGAGVAFFIGDKYVYQPVFQPVLGSVVPFQLAPVGSGQVLVSASPAVLWVATLVFFIVFLALAPPDSHGRSMAQRIIGLGIFIESFITIFGMLFAIPGSGNGGNFLLPPMTPFTGFGMLWLLSAFYIVLGFGIWYNSKAALWAYLILQIAGFTYALVTLNWLSALFGGLIILYLLALRPQYKHFLGQIGHLRSAF